jgi:hypothetical protein
VFQNESYEAEREAERAYVRTICNGTILCMINCFQDNKLQNSVRNSCKVRVTTDWNKSNQIKSNQIKSNSSSIIVHNSKLMENSHGLDILSDTHRQLLGKYLVRISSGTPSKQMPIPPRPLTSKFSPIYHSSVNLPFDDISSRY